MNPALEYRKLTLADVRPAAEILSEAFQEDPLCAFMLPNRRSRRSTLYKFFLVLGAISIQNNRGYGVGQPLQGVAYWKSPDQVDLSISIKSIGKLFPSLFTQYPLGYWRARAILRQVEAMHTKYANEPHYYLDNIGVLSSARGQGISSKLIRPILELADIQKLIAYTETESPANVPPYAHLGFQLMEECPIPGTPITVFPLRRPVT